MKVFPGQDNPWTHILLILNGLCSTRGAGGLRFLRGKGQWPWGGLELRHGHLPLVLLSLAVFTGKENFWPSPIKQEKAMPSRGPCFQERQREKMRRIAAFLSCYHVSFWNFSLSGLHLLWRASINWTFYSVSGPVLSILCPLACFTHFKFYEPRIVLPAPFNKWENWGRERLCNLASVSQLLVQVI